MTARLVMKYTSGWASPVDLEVSPCPAIGHEVHVIAMTRGQYYLDVEEGGAMEGTAKVEGKPPYRVPTMAEVGAVEKNGFRAISTFSGCGGSSLGYRMAGFDVLWANEFIPAAIRVYQANASPSTVVETGDIRKVSVFSVLGLLGLRPGELDLLDGSPPCASFSTAGKRDEGWGAVRKYSDTKQRTDDLFFEFARFVEGMRPKVFVAENVSGLVRGVAIGYFNDVQRLLRSFGYRVEAKLLDAQWLGVPQQRMRIIIQGVRNDLGLAPAWPKALAHRYSVADACPWIKGDILGPEGARDGVSIEGTAIGGEWDKLKEGEQSGRYFNLVRADSDAPTPTILASHGEKGIASVTHPTEKRKFSIAELKRLCGFPDNFDLDGPPGRELTYAEKWERLGRAVPPLMMRAVAEAVRDRVLIPARERRR